MTHPVPAEALKQHIAILDKTGSGKSYTAQSLAEFVLASGDRLAVIDPTVRWWGLRSNTTAKPGHEIAAPRVAAARAAIDVTCQGGRRTLISISNLQGLVVSASGLKWQLAVGGTENAGRYLRGRPVAQIIPFMESIADTKSAQAETAQMWDRVYEVVGGNRFPHEYLVKYIFFLQQWRQFTRLRALDIGFGSFANLNMCHEAGYEIAGIEVSQRALDKTRAEMERRGVPFDGRLFTSPEIPFEDDRFELVYSSQAIYYNLELERMVAEIDRCLVPGGAFYLSFFAPDHWYFEHSEPAGPGLRRWSETHPTKQLRGMTLRYFASKEELAALFTDFANVRVDDFYSNMLGIEFHMWLLTGVKATEGLQTFKLEDHYGNIERLAPAAPKS